MSDGKQGSPGGRAGSSSSGPSSDQTRSGSSSNNSSASGTTSFMGGSSQGKIPAKENIAKGHPAVRTLSKVEEDPREDMSDHNSEEESEDGDQVSELPPRATTFNSTRPALQNRERKSILKKNIIKKSTAAAMGGGGGGVQNRLTTRVTASFGSGLNAAQPLRKSTGYAYADSEAAFHSEDDDSDDTVVLDENFLPVMKSRWHAKGSVFVGRGSANDNHEGAVDSD